MIPSLCPWWLCLALLSYAGVRFLSAGCSGFSEGIVISTGVAAGCAQGNQRGWRSTTSCRSRTSCIHPPRLRNGRMTWHSERNLRRIGWSTRWWRRLFSWCGTFKSTSWRLRQSLWSLQLHQAMPNRLCQLLQDMTYTASQAKDLRLDVIVQGWWSRCSARDARKRTRTCITEFGIAVPTQVRALTRHSISFKKPLKPNTSECFWLKGVVPRSWTLQDTKLGFWRRRVDQSLHKHLWGRLWNAQRPANQGEGWATNNIVEGMSSCLGQTMQCWKRHSERPHEQPQARRRLDGHAR